MSKKYKNLGQDSEKTRKGVELLVIKDNTSHEEDAQSEAPVTIEQPAKVVAKSESKRKIERSSAYATRKVSNPSKRERKQSSVKVVPEDFKNHSCLFSSAQLDDLRTAVYLKKAKVDKKYSIKDAVYEAFELFLSSGRPKIDKYPDDFITYTPLISMEQFEKVTSLVYTVKATEDKRYGTKYAVYEALQMYLNSI